MHSILKQIKGLKYTGELLRVLYLQLLGEDRIEKSIPGRCVIQRSINGFYQLIRFLESMQVCAGLLFSA